MSGGVESRRGEVDEVPERAAAEAKAPAVALPAIGLPRDRRRRDDQVSSATTARTSPMHPPKWRIDAFLILLILLDELMIV